MHEADVVNAMTGLLDARAGRELNVAGDGTMTRLSALFTGWQQFRPDCA